MSAPYKEWYEDDDTASSSPMGSPSLHTRVPSAWIKALWWLAALAFVVLWIAQSWTAIGVPTNIVNFGQISRDVFGLLVALTLCFATLRFWQGRAHNLGPTLCILVAAIALLWHGR